VNRKVAVIGSNSFSGSHFIDSAIKVGYEVIGISRSSELNAVFLPYKKHQNLSNFLFCQLDLNYDLKEIMTIIQEIQPDYVVNFAAQSMVAESWVHPEHWFQTNVVAIIKLHDQLRQCCFLKKYVHISTPEVYGNCNGLVRENVNYQPSTPYAVSRVATDMSLMTFFKAYNFPVIFTRSANVYGPGQQLYRIIPRTILYFLLGKKLQLHGGGRSLRSFIHIEDVVDGILRIINKAEIGEIFHFSTARNISIRSLVKLIAEQMEISFEDFIETIGERLGKDNAYLLDSEKARKILGWKDRISLEQGIKETINWVKNNFAELKKQPFEYIHKP